MKTLTFNENQCVKINNEEEFESCYPFLRSAKNGKSFDAWLSVNKFPNLFRIRWQYHRLQRYTL